jgi:hypothetical protein
MRLAAGLALGVIFVVGLVYATLQQTGVRCEVCVEFEGRTECRTSSAADRDTAISMGVTNACAVLSSGVTQGIRCQSMPPIARCEE